ncbi:16549_t:CDS:2 [Rhizophagus irregularis]|nr:16549_t:CDS:2 [Rhizophagus irregularis]
MPVVVQALVCSSKPSLHWASLKDRDVEMTVKGFISDDDENARLLWSSEFSTLRIYIDENLYKNLYTINRMRPEYRKE